MKNWGNIWHRLDHRKKILNRFKASTFKSDHLKTHWRNLTLSTNLKIWFKIFHLIRNNLEREVQNFMTIQTQIKVCWLFLHFVCLEFYLLRSKSIGSMTRTTHTRVIKQKIIQVLRLNSYETELLSQNKSQNSEKVIKYFQLIYSQ